LNEVLQKTKGGVSSVKVKLLLYQTARGKIWIAAKKKENGDNLLIFHDPPGFTATNPFWHKLFLTTSLSLPFPLPLSFFFLFALSPSFLSFFLYLSLSLLSLALFLFLSLTISFSSLFFSLFFLSLSPLSNSISL